MATKTVKKSAAKKAPAKTAKAAAPKYGYFDDAAKEYVLTTPATPIKWWRPGSQPYHQVHCTDAVL